MLLSALEACKIYPKGGIDENYSYLGYVMVDFPSTISLLYSSVALFRGYCVWVSCYEYLIGRQQKK